MKLVMFDIDGTLTRTSDADGLCFGQALREVFAFVNIDTDWANFAASQPFNPVSGAEISSWPKPISPCRLPAALGNVRPASSRRARDWTAPTSRPRFRMTRSRAKPSCKRRWPELRAHAAGNVFHAVLGDRDGSRINSTNRAVFFAVFALDSKRVVTMSYDGTARVWDTETGQELIPPLKHQGAIFHAVFSPDGRRMVTASADWTAQVWDANTGQPVGLLLQHDGAVLHADFSPDGRTIVTASYDMTAQVWDAETGSKPSPPLKHPNEDNGPVFTVKFSPDGQQIVTASYDGTAQVWDVRTGNKTMPPFRHEIARTFRMTIKARIGVRNAKGKKPVHAQTLTVSLSPPRKRRMHDCRR